MTIAITGANGFVARNLIALLLEDTAAREIRAIVRDAATARRELPSAELELVTADVTEPDTLRAAFDGCEAVVHTVAIPTERKATFETVNARGTEHVVAEAKRAGVRRIVHLSAIGADPESPFPFLRSKGRGERAVAACGIAYVALRPSILFGKGDDFFPKLGFSLRFPVVPVPGDGSARFQPLHVGDVAKVIRAALRGTMAGVHEIAGPDVVTYDELLTETMRGYRKRRPRLHLPVPLMKPAAVAMGLVMADPPVTVAQLDLLKTDNVPARNAIEQVFGVTPRPFRGALGYLSA
ncbi:MAG TPA: complex I NDUFA9 subunit family protein [Candidatus Limnocylindria bacterium]|nr:complex I NDUFA9 subunit family protein [Candidatus Limnocylindria bacterium]